MTYRITSDTGISFGLYEAVSTMDALSQLAHHLASETGWPLEECQDLVDLGRYEAVPIS